MPWTHYNCTVNNKPSVVLICTDFGKRIPHPELEYLYWIGVWAEPEIIPEDVLLKTAEQIGNGWLVYSHRISGIGMTEYYFYGQSDLPLSSLPHKMKEKTDIRIEVDSKLDSTWQEYQAYLKPLIG